MQFKPSTQPESSRELIARSLTLYRHAFSHVFFLALALSVIAFIPRLLATLVGADILEAIPDYSPQKLWLILINFVILIFFIALLWRIRCVIKHQHESIFDDFKVAFKKFIYIIVASFIQNILIISLMILSIIFTYFFIFHEKNMIITDMPTLFFIFIFFVFQLTLELFIFFLFYFYLPIIVVENKSILESLKKSASLVWHNLGKTIWVQLFPWFIYLLVLLLVKFGLRIDIHIFLLGTQVPSLANTILHILLFALFIPWVACVLLLQLHDLELREAIPHSK